MAEEFIRKQEMEEQLRRAALHSMHVQTETAEEEAPSMATRPSEEDVVCVCVFVCVCVCVSVCLCLCLCLFLCL